MEKTINKSNSIRKAAEIYENDSNLFLRHAVTLHNIYHISITNYLTNKTKSAPNYFVIYQKLTPVEKNILKQHIFRTYNADFSLSIQHLNHYINEILRMRDSIATIDYH
jgi:hypothetical protein